MSDNPKAERIKPDLRKALGEFLDDVRYQKEFIAMSNVVGCTSRKPEKYKAALFTVVNEEIGFVIAELNVMFEDWQIEQQLLKNPAVVEQMKDNPDVLQDYIKAARMMMNDEADVKQADLTKLT